MKGAFLYVNGSAGTSATYRANRRAFEKFGIIPRMLVNATERNLEVSYKLLIARWPSVNAFNFD